MGRLARPPGGHGSPIDVSLVASGGTSFHDARAVGRTVSWIEQRPTDGGRGMVVELLDDAEPVDVLPAGWSARSRVYAYGGGAVTTDGRRYWFCNDVNSGAVPAGGHPNDQRVFVTEAGRVPMPLTAVGQYCYGDLTLDPVHDAVLAVREDWRGVDDGLPLVELVSISCVDGAVSVLATGADFYAAPALSPDGGTLAWIEWDWPHMPWDATRLFTRPLDAHGLSAGPATLVTGGVAESVAEPRWSPDGVLHFVSDRSGWASIYRLDDASIRPVAVRDSTEWTAPNWGLGVHTYGFERSGRLWAARTRNGRWRLTTPGRRSKKVKAETVVTQVAAGDGVVAYVAAGPRMVPTMSLREGRTAAPRRIRPSIELSGDVLDAVTEALPITFPTTDGAVAHAFFYPPAVARKAKKKRSKKRKRSKKKTAFPIMIRSHGGPTAAAASGLDLETQYFTTRGFGVVDVNYRGSTGFGRDYLLSLYGQWGVRDVADCVAAADHVASEYGGDRTRTVARGGSAGGYATNCLAAFTDALAAGASYYGISDLIALVKVTENFERHYVDELVGPLPAFDAVYRKRSPINFADRVNCPMAFLQGAEDPVVPPDQTKRFAEKLEQRGIPVVVDFFPNEQHGLRIAAHLEAALEAEFEFYSKQLSRGTRRR